MNIQRCHGLIIVLLLPLLAGAADPDADQIVRDTVNNWRGVSSYTEMTMVIHRPDWERSMSMRAWTRGDKQSLVRVTSPQKDRGNGTLTDGNNMWSYSPKVNRVIKVPSSMMAQSWMGSDFSNQDVSKSNAIVDEFDHTLLGTTRDGDFTVYEIQSVPHEEAAVVWGKEILRIRSDYVLLQQDYFDQDGKRVKTLRTLKIATMDGRQTAVQQRVGDVDRPGAWTEIRVAKVRFDIDIPDSTFTLSNLRNPRN